MSPPPPPGALRVRSVSVDFALDSPAVHTAALDPPAAIWPSGLGAALKRSLTPRVLTSDVDVAPPGVASFAISPPRVHVNGFRFPAPVDAFATPSTACETPRRFAPPAVDAPPKPATRLTPPADIIRLDDRLWYLLQPSLESLTSSRRLALPHEPFAYQYAGIAFLYPRHSAVLADEMGLGKTMQAITALRLLLRSGEIRTALLICPKPLIHNWQHEFASWAPEIPLLTVAGPQHRRDWLWRRDHHGVLLANYETIVRDEHIIDQSAHRFDLVVLDESQRIKNPNSATAQSCRALRRRRSWALTGTPIENRLDDLVGIFDFLAPGRITAAMKPRRVAREISDFILRRTKDQVLDDLPPKLFRDPELDLTSTQRESYRLAEEDGVLRLTRLGDTATIQHVLELVTRLKQICNFDPATGDSAKLEQLQSDLAEVVASGQKAIVFSQWVTTLQQLAERLQSFRPLQYHGRVPANRRQQVLQQFRDDPDRPLLLLSYGAGGVGLNLQFASYVFLFDRWWNPAVEDQAINRAHRIGSAGPVTVTRFLTTGTIEQRIDEILREKRELFDSIFAAGEVNPSSSLSKEEIFGLFSLDVARRAA